MIIMSNNKKKIIKTYQIFYNNMFNYNQFDMIFNILLHKIFKIKRFYFIKYLF